MMTSTQVVGMSVSVIANSLSQDYTHLDDHLSLTFDMTPGFKPLREGTFLFWGGGGAGALEGRAIQKNWDPWEGSSLLILKGEGESSYRYVQIAHVLFQLYLDVDATTICSTGLHLHRSIHSTMLTMFQTLQSFPLHPSLITSEFSQEFLS